MSANPASANGHRRSIWRTVAVVVTGISIIAFVGLMIGALASLEGFEEGEDATVLGTIAWFGFSLGAVAALITGLIAFLLGRREHRATDRRAGQIAIAWFLFAVLAVVIISALD